MNLINATTGEVVANKACTKSELEKRLALEGVTVAQTEQIMSTLGMSTANATATVSFKLLSASILSSVKAIGLWLVTNPVGWATIAVTAISAVVLGINAYNKKQEELREEAIESARATQELTDSMDDLISQYEGIVDSEKSESEKTKELTEWKQTLAETYGITKDKLANLNLEREEGIELLKEEIRLAKIRQQDDWRDKNEDVVAKSRQRLDRVSKFNSNGYSYMDGTDVWTQQSSSVSNDIKALFDRIERTNGGLDIQLKIDTDNAIEELERLQSISNEITNISFTRTLTSSEQQLLDDIKSQIAYLETFQSDIDVVKQDISANAFIKFETYKTNDESYKNLGKESYISWRDGLLKTANGDKLLEKELLSLAEQQFPDYAKYFENLNKAKIQFGATKPNSGFDALKKSLLEQLTNEQLEIAIQIPDLFSNGSFDGTLKSITDRIEAWNKANGNLEVKFNYAEYSEQVDDVVKNIDTLQSALDNLNSGKSLEAKDITELANSFPDYSTKILSAANSTEELKLVLTDIKRNAPKSLINTLENLSGLSKQDQEAVNGLISVLTTVNSKTSTYADTLADLETKESLLSSVYKEMHDDGQISISTYQKLIEMGDDYANMVTVVNGKITVNTQDLKELTKKKYEDEIATLKLTKAELGYNIASNPQNYSLYAEKMSAIDADIEAKEKALELLNGFDYTDDNKKKSDDPWKDKAEAKIAEIQHLEAMNKITHEQYIDELDKINQKYYANNEKYLTEFNKYDEEVFKGRRELAEKAFDDIIDGIEKEIDALDKLKDNASLDINAEGSIYSIIDQQILLYQQAIDEIGKRIAELEASGLVGIEDEIEELNKQRDDLLEKVYDLGKERTSIGVDNEIKYWEEMQSKQNDFYGKQIEKLKKQKELLEDKNDEEERAKDLAEKQLELRKAEIALEDARRNRNVLVYTAGATNNC